MGRPPDVPGTDKNFVFSDEEATSLSVKLTVEEAAAVVATDPGAQPTGYGLGRHGWISLDLEPDCAADRWQEVAEWIVTSYTLVAPKRLARAVLERERAEGQTGHIATKAPGAGQ